MPAKSPDPDLLVINTIRTLSMDAVQAANSGHPGTPMALAPVVYCLWQDFLRFDPEDPIWPNRDRFVLSNGHASMLLYSMLHLTGVKAVNSQYERQGELAVKLDDIKRFRQLDSKCPGHPEYRLTSGVETTTGPLGQGVATSVGMAIAGRWQAAHFNRPGFELFDYDVYAVCGDGDMMEGISGEAASLAGHLKLSNLCWIYDNNKITIEGHTDWAFSDDTATRFIGYGWNVTRVGDANDLDMLRRALPGLQEHHAIGPRSSSWTATSPTARPPSRTPAPPTASRWAKRRSASPSGSTAGRRTPSSWSPTGSASACATASGSAVASCTQAWLARYEDYEQQHPDLADHLHRMQHRQLPDGWDRDLPTFPADPKGMAGRDASAKVLNAIAKNLPWLIGGAADLAPSTKTRLTFDGAGDLTGGEPRRPEHALRDPRARDGRGGERDVALQAAGLRLHLPHLQRLRPAGHPPERDHGDPHHLRLHARFDRGGRRWTDAPADRAAGLAPGHPRPDHHPPGRRQRGGRGVAGHHEAAAPAGDPGALPAGASRSSTGRRYAAASGVARGAYVLADAEDGKPDLILLASGSEVSLCVEAFERLTSEGIRARVVSMPSWELFEQQDPAYRDAVLPPEVTARVSVEQAGTFGWERYVGSTGTRIGMKTFGASAPLKELQKKFGFTSEHVVDAARVQLARRAEAVSAR